MGIFYYNKMTLGKNKKLAKGKGGKKGKVKVDPYLKKSWVKGICPLDFGKPREATVLGWSP